MNQLVPINLQPGMLLYKYELLKKIGNGEFGDVWLARDHALNREYAIKILKPGLSIDERLREAQIGNRLTHNNLIYVHQADVVTVNKSDVVMIAMDYMPNGSIKNWANPGSYLPLPKVLNIARDILQGLEYLHARAIYHNDIKPGNILIGTDCQAILTDYGITGVSSNRSSVPAPNAYRLHLAPEVLSTGNINQYSDIFQVGMTLARLLIHLDHFREISERVGPDKYNEKIASGKLLQKQHFGSHIPLAVQQIIRKATNPKLEKRYKTALEMRRAFEKLKYPGFWTVDSEGAEIGESGDYYYRYLIAPSSNGNFRLTCVKRNKRTSRETRVQSFCKNNLTLPEANLLSDNFKASVVTGK